MRINLKLRNIIKYSLVFIFILSSILLFYYLKEYLANNSLYNDIKKSDPLKNSNMQSSYKHLKSLNNDYVGWINISNTKVDYPIVKGADNSFYLNHNFLKSKSEAGSIFIDYNSTPFTDRNTIIYGHYMKDGSMFGSFNQLLKDTDSNHRIFIALEDKVIQYSIFSIYKEEANINSYQTFWINDTSYLEYLNNLQSKSILEFNLTLTPSDKILTLSTCSYNTPNGRLLIHAKMIN